MIEVCLITETFGGIATYTNYLSENLQMKEKYDVDTLTINYNYERQYKTDHVITSNTNHMISIKSYEQIANVIGNAVINSTDDIIHFQHEFNIFRSNRYFLELLANIKNNSNKKIILTLHSVFTDAKRIRFFRNCSELIDRFIVHQENAKQFLTDIGVNRNKIIVIPHGTPKLNKNHNSSGFFKSDKIKIIFSGFLTETKSIEQALLSLISCPKFEIIVAGMVKDEGVLRRIKTLKEKSKAILRIIPRFLSKEEHQTVIKDADYLILPYNQNYYSASGMLHLGISLGTITLVSSSPKFEELVKRVPECEVKDGNYKQTILDIEQLNIQKEILKKELKFAEETSWVKVAKMTGKVYDYLFIG